MSFSSDVKKELCVMDFDCEDCCKAEIAGFLLCKRDSDIILNTENNASARRLVSDIVRCSNVIVDISSELITKGGKRHFAVSIPHEEEREQVLELIFGTAFEKECCRIFLLRGAFLASGTITNPEKDYHAEFSVFSENNAAFIQGLLSDFGIKSKITLRGNAYVIYIKGSEAIEDFLGKLGALNSYWKILEVVIEKDIRNKANRAANCDSANIGRTVAAASKQIDAIIKIRDNLGFDKLSEELKEIAIIRLENPELSLREIGELLPNISRSGINHRLKKLIDIAEDL